MRQLLNDQLEELRTEMDRTVNKNGLRGKEYLGENTNGRLPERENGMVKLEAIDDEIERSAT